MRGEVVTNMSVECRVGVVGASKVGKSSLINAFQGEIRTGSRTVRSVGGRMVAFRVVEAQSNQFEVETIDNVDVLLLCFSVAAPLSALPRHRPRTHQPLVLVGCKADLRRKPRYSEHHKAGVVSSCSSRLGEAQPLVAARQALALCRHLGAVMYVETEAGAPPSVLAAFEVVAFINKAHIKNRTKPKSCRWQPLPILDTSHQPALREPPPHSWVPSPVPARSRDSQ